MKKMKQNNNKTQYNIDPTKVFDINEVGKEPEDNLGEYNPDEDVEVDDDTLPDALRVFRNKFMPYQRYIMIVGFTILIFLVVFLGYARGALDICNDLGGRLEVNLLHIKCHPSQYIPATDAVNPNLIAIGGLE